MGKSLGYLVHLVDTQVGRVALREHLVDDFDIDDFMSTNTLSQGVVIQFQEAGKNVDPNKVIGAVPTAFGGTTNGG